MWPPGAATRRRIRRRSAWRACGGHAQGFALVDIIVACSVVAVLSAMAVPTMLSLRDRDTARMAARYLAHRLQAVRLDAIRRNRQVGLRFDAVAPHAFRTYEDGDGDGVTAADIESGTDVPIDEGARLEDVFGRVRFGIAETVPRPEGGGSLDAGGDPIRFGTSRVISFSPTGQASSGTLYLASGNGFQICLRIFGATGRMRVLWFDGASRTWRQD